MLFLFDTDADIWIRRWVIAQIFPAIRPNLAAGVPFSFRSLYQLLEETSRLLLSLGLETCLLFHVWSPLPQPWQFTEGKYIYTCRLTCVNYPHVVVVVVHSHQSQNNMSGQIFRSHCARWDFHTLEIKYIPGIFDLISELFIYLLHIWIVETCRGSV